MKMFLFGLLIFCFNVVNAEKNKPSYSDIAPEKEVSHKLLQQAPLADKPKIAQHRLATQAEAPSLSPKKAADVQTQAPKKISIIESFKKFIGISSPKEAPVSLKEKEASFSLENKKAPEAIEKLDRDFVGRVAKVMKPETWSADEIKKIGASNEKAIDHFMSTEDKKMLMDVVDNKLLKIEAEDYKTLPIEKKREVYALVQFRLQQLKMGDNAMAAIGESRKGVERSIEEYKTEARAKGETAHNINVMVKNIFDADFKKLNADTEAVKEKFGFTPETRKSMFDALTKIDVAIAGEVKLKENEENINNLLLQKKLSPDQKIKLKNSLAVYGHDFVNVYNDTPKEKQAELLKASKSILQKGYSSYLKTEAEKIKNKNWSIAQRKKELKKSGSEGEKKANLDKIRELETEKQKVIDDIATMKAVIKALRKNDSLLEKQQATVQKTAPEVDNQVLRKNLEELEKNAPKTTLKLLQLDDNIDSQKKRIKSIENEIKKTEDEGQKEVLEKQLKLANDELNKFLDDKTVVKRESEKHKNFEKEFGSPLDIQRKLLTGSVSELEDARLKVENSSKENIGIAKVELAKTERRYVDDLYKLSLTLKDSSTSSPEIKNEYINLMRTIKKQSKLVKNNLAHMSKEIQKKEVAINEVSAANSEKLIKLFNDSKELTAKIRATADPEVKAELEAQKRESEKERMALSRQDQDAQEEVKALKLQVDFLNEALK